MKSIFLDVINLLKNYGFIGLGFRARVSGQGRGLGAGLRVRVRVRVRVVTFLRTCGVDSLARHESRDSRSRSTTTGSVRGSADSAVVVVAGWCDICGVVAV